MSHSLKNAVQDYVERRTLTTARLEQLEELMASNHVSETIKRRTNARLVVGMSLAAAAVLATVFLLLPTTQINDIPMTERIAIEVANNHIKMKPLDITTGNMDELREYFNDLDFVPVQSRLLANADLELLGGRYCSVQSIPAAQLRISGADSGKLQTLYQTEYREDVFHELPRLEDGEEPVTVLVKGIQVTIWVEKGLLFALTEEPQLESIIQP